MHSTSRSLPFPGGPHTLTVIAGGASNSVQFTVISNGLYTSQTGLTFNAIQVGPNVPARSFSVLSGQGTIHFSLAASTVSGAGWLSANPSAGTSMIATSGTPIQVTVNPGNLGVGSYYGSVTITSTDVSNSPQSVSVIPECECAKHDLIAHDR